MEIHDAITSLASKEANRVIKFRNQEEEEDDRHVNGLPHVPTIHVQRRNATSECIVTSSGESGHPNEGRMGFIKQWLQSKVLTPNGECEGNPTGTYRIELHDSTTYLPRAPEYQNVLSFGRSVNSVSTVAMFPDPYQAANYSGLGIDVVDDIPWRSKRPTVLFAGSTTGSLNYALNVRIRACRWSLDHPIETDFRISSIVQMNPFDVVRQQSRMKDMLAPHISVEMHHAYKFIANIVGNTACWSRLPMVFRSQSMLFHLSHDDMTWYYPILRPGKHYVECATQQDFLTHRRECLADETGCQIVVDEARKFSNAYLNQNAAETYTRHLLFNIRGQ